MILILTRPTDSHSFFVEEALLRKGGLPLLWHTSDFPQHQAWTIEGQNDGGVVWDLHGPGFHLKEVPRVIWDRRPGPPIISSAVHPADQKFAERECRTFYQWLHLLLSRDAFWVNPPQAARSVASKIGQQVAARRVGLRVLPTIYSNDPTKIRAFAAEHKEIVYKPFTQSGLWMLPGKGAAALYTAIATAEYLSDDAVLSATPGIYQPLIYKESELRITVIGEYVFPARIRSQEMKRGKLDWRVDPKDLQIEATDIPASLERAIRSLMKDLGLVFGCLDFIITPSGETIFLEVNDMGQFLFVEARTEIPLLDAFCELLLQGRSDFEWNPSSVSVRAQELDELIMQRVEAAERNHISPPDFFSVEQEEAAPSSTSSSPQGISLP